MNLRDPRPHNSNRVSTLFNSCEKLHVEEVSTLGRLAIKPRFLLTIRRMKLWKDHPRVRRTLWSPCPQCQSYANAAVTASPGSHGRKRAYHVFLGQELSAAVNLCLAKGKVIFF